MIYCTEQSNLKKFVHFSNNNVIVIMIDSKNILIHFDYVSQSDHCESNKKMEKREKNI